MILGFQTHLRIPLDPVEPLDVAGGPSKRPPKESTRCPKSAQRAPKRFQDSPCTRSSCSLAVAVAVPSRSSCPVASPRLPRLPRMATTRSRSHNSCSRCPKGHRWNPGQGLATLAGVAWGPSGRPRGACHGGQPLIVAGDPGNIGASAPMKAGLTWYERAKPGQARPDPCGHIANIPHHCMAASTITLWARAKYAVLEFLFCRSHSHPQPKLRSYRLRRPH